LTTRVLDRFSGWNDNLRSLIMEQYQKALKSLCEGARTLTIDGLEIEVRNCSDRIEGRLDPRSALIFSLKREEFERNFNSYDKELWPNGIHIFGPRNTENRTNLEIYRASFGWKSNDLSRNVHASYFCVPSKWGPVLVYKYKAANQKESSPCLVFFHGGGFFAGDTETVENQCKLIAERAGVLVLSVDYPLAPENPFPIGFDCCYAVLEYVHANADMLGIDGTKICVSGDSAGGNLAVVCALRNRDENRWPLAYMALIYPTLSRAEKPGDPHWYWDASLYNNPENDPVISLQSGRSSKHSKELNGWYIPAGMDMYYPYLSPIAGSPERLPRTLIITAEYDFLRIGCEEYTRMLKKAGVPCRHIRYGGITHATFDRLGYAPQAEDMVQEIVKDLNSL